MMRDFLRVVKPVLAPNFNQIIILKYANESLKWIARWLKTIDGMGNEYFFVRNIDNKACVTTQKQWVLSKYRSVDQWHIQIVIQEIENWYLAGLSEKKRKQLRISRSQIPIV